MSNRRIRTVIIFGIISIISILTIQIFWIEKNIQFQETNIRIQKQQDSLNTAQFNDKVIIALKKVADDIQKLNNADINLYGNVQQRSNSYFTVEMQDTVHPFLLEQLLKWEFDDKNLREDFQFGIYDCWSDSIIYGNYMNFEADSIYTADHSIDFSNFIIDEVALKLNTDLHYFGVYFPSRGHSHLMQIPNPVTPWAYLITIILFVIAFFIFAVNIIFRQKRLSEIKNDFINNMTHELKTPIATIRISSETLLNMDENADLDKRLRYAGIIYKENKRLEQQVERVLNIAKLDKKELKFKIQNFDMVDIIEEAKENFEFSQLEDIGGSISLNLNAENHIVTGDIVHITNVINNLIDNAIKYCDKIPEISISTQNEKRKLYITVADNGKGISKDDIKFIFDKFYRVPTGNLHDVKGFGLGLYYVKTILEELGGSINVKSEPGKGSAFTITLPLKD
ncbi:HAMP domain-containing histidine kinase [Paracrocinitomix mangrovi]|uniref:sensor histidine kinase n=1 Tax=Paracrocinitomix mangrovi TaxID=2862509 RepID=UPI001C8E8D55|nr:HAMP domain-containing sensor histidine kinase [Paracrocinitomix mangrovi]UKN03317.1 HAMP domain-containing histidine kinase [Paracrocinitomix mangrovi]